jgi:beta-glucosidase
VQEDLLKAVTAAGKPVVLVLTSGSAIAVNRAAANAGAIVQLWYPGEEGGAALADVLFGDYNPAGRLPVTFYKSVDQLPPFEDYRMTGRTYRYFRGEPLFPFGHGLSYTTFEYSRLELPRSAKPGDEITVRARVKNIGKKAGDEVVQLYVKHLSATAPVPIHSLQGFKRIHLQPAEVRVVTFTLAPRQLSLIDNRDQRVVEPGEFEISVGGSQPGASSTQSQKAKLKLTGDRFAVE